MLTSYLPYFLGIDPGAGQFISSFLQLFDNFNSVLGMLTLLLDNFTILPEFCFFTSMLDSLTSVEVIYPIAWQFSLESNYLWVMLPQFCLFTLLVNFIFILVIYSFAGQFDLRSCFFPNCWKVLY